MLGILQHKIRKENEVDYHLDISKVSLNCN